MEHLRAWARTHCGTARSHNEDAFLDAPDSGMWAVADGAGGHEAGEVASDLVIQSLASIPPSLSADEALAQVRLRVAAAHLALRERAARMGENVTIATTVVVLIVRQGHFACLWAGDSRGYLLRNGHLAQITRDHSLVQEMVDAGALLESEAEAHPHANVITRAVGADTEMLELDKVTGRLLPGDRFMLCSDGLTKVLGSSAIEAKLADPSVTEPADALLEAALASRTPDNVTAVVVDVAA